MELVYITVELGALAVAITAIWILLSRFNKSLDGKIGKIVDDKLTRSEDRMAEQMDEKDKSSNKDVLYAVKALNERFTEYTAQQDKYNKNDTKRFTILEQSLVESYKKQIRNIYYEARINGVIHDSDMAYMQKIFPLYIAMGGNSDIEAKYEEMQKVYAEVLSEKFKAARTKSDQENEQK